MRGILRGTAVFSHRVLPIPRVPPNVVGMDEGSRAKDERKKKSVRKARGDRSITNHYGPSGTASERRRRFDACSSFVTFDFTPRCLTLCTNHVTYFLQRFILQAAEHQQRNYLIIRKLIINEKRRSNRCVVEIISTMVFIIFSFVSNNDKCVFLLVPY